MIVRYSLGTILHVALAVLVAVPAAKAKTVYVSPSGDDANSGLSWAAAKRTVQAAINLASAEGGEVWVAAGVYPERITLLGNVHVYGGFNGTESLRDDRDWSGNVTILDGQAGGSVVTVINTPFGSNTIDGLTIQNGAGTSYGSYAVGGGILCATAAPTIANSVIKGNVIAGRGFGGGVYCGNSSPTIFNTVIQGNAVGDSGQGGGIYCVNSPLTITKGIVKENTTGASGWGGGISCSSSPLTLTESSISGNVAGSGGGGLFCHSSSPVIRGCRFQGNLAIRGGGIYCESSSPAISSTIILENSAATGGGIECDSSSAPVIVCATIAANGGGEGGGAHFSTSSQAKLVNSIVAFNSSGVWNQSESAVLRYNCVYGNVGYDYYGSADPTGTAGNLAADPQFANLALGDLHIQPGSPCRDAGDDASIEAGWLDIDGQSRREGVHVDMGADESDGTLWPALPRVIVRVSPNGDDANDGASWGSAKKSLQAAIDAASPSNGEVWVQAGVYQECITLRRAHVYGGFAGTEVERQQRDPSLHETVLDGNHGGPVVVAEGSGFRASTLDGFTLRNGTGRLHRSASYGGGVYCYRAAPVISNNTITDNRDVALGGGIYCSYSFPIIIGNLISGNASTAAGGGIYSGSSSPQIIGNRIVYNKSVDGQPTYGGGVDCFGGVPDFADNVISGNSAAKGGGVHLYSGQCRFVGNTVTANSAGELGAAMLFEASGSLMAVNNIVAFNSSGLARVGPASAVLRYNCVYGNEGGNYIGMTDPTGSDGNISVDPQLIAVVYGNNHIRNESPCRNGGDTTAVQGNWGDIDGEPRVEGGQVDIGADESDGRSWPSGPPVIVRVTDSGDDANDGSTWPRAKRTVQAAIAAAGTAGGEVWVSAGTYAERITLRRNVVLLGGFSGEEAASTDRDPAVNVTVIDGEQSGSVVTAVDPGFGLSVINGFIIRNGQATSEGGGILCRYSSPLIVNNTLMQNKAAYGGGMFTLRCSPLISDNTILENTATWGGAMQCSHSNSVIVNNRIVGNVAATFGGGIRLDYATAVVANNLITANRVEVSGGGIYVDGYASPAKIIGNTITANVARYGGASGGGLYLGGGESHLIVNNIVAFNWSGIRRASSKAQDLRYNCVYGNAVYDFSGLDDPTGTGGNIAADPRFVRNAGSGPDGTWGTTDDDYGDLHLQVTSPCIDAGENAAVLPGTVVDLTGRDRFVDIAGMLDTGSGTPPIVDIGAYEHHPATAADLNNDGQVDLDDLNVFLACCSGPAMPYNPQELPAVDGCSLWPLADDRIVADFDGDGDVDQEDFGTIQRCYSGAGPVEPGCMTESTARLHAPGRCRSAGSVKSTPQPRAEGVHPSFWRA